MFRVGSIDVRKPLARWTALATAPFVVTLVALSITGIFLHQTTLPAIAGILASSALAFATALYAVTLWGESNDPISKDKTLLAVSFSCCAVLAAIVLLLVLSISIGVVTVLLPLATLASGWVISSMPKKLQTELDAANKF